MQTNVFIACLLVQELVEQDCNKRKMGFMASATGFSALMFPAAMIYQSDLTARNLFLAP